MRGFGGVTVAMWTVLEARAGCVPLYVQLRSANKVSGTMRVSVGLISPSRSNKNIEIPSQSAVASRHGHSSPSPITDLAGIGIDSVHLRSERKVAKKPRQSNDHHHVYWTEQ